MDNNTVNPTQEKKSSKKKLILITASFLLIVTAAFFIKSNFFKDSATRFSFYSELADYPVSNKQVNQQLLKQILASLNITSEQQFVIFDQKELVKPKQVNITFKDIRPLQPHETTKFVDIVLSQVNNQKRVVRGFAANYDQDKQILNYDVYLYPNLNTTQSQEIRFINLTRTVYRLLFLASRTITTENDQQLYEELIQKILPVQEKRSVFNIKTQTSLLKKLIVNLHQLITVKTVYAGCSGSYECGWWQSSCECGDGSTCIENNAICPDLSLCDCTVECRPDDCGNCGVGWCGGFDAARCIQSAQCLGGACMIPGSNDCQWTGAYPTNTPIPPTPPPGATSTPVPTPGDECPYNWWGCSTSTDCFPTAFADEAACWASGASNCACGYCPCQTSQGKRVFVIFDDVNGDGTWDYNDGERRIDTGSQCPATNTRYVAGFNFVIDGSPYGYNDCNLGNNEFTGTFCSWDGTNATCGGDGSQTCDIWGWEEFEIGDYCLVTHSCQNPCCDGWESARGALCWEQNGHYCSSSGNAGLKSGHILRITKQTGTHLVAVTPPAGSDWYNTTTNPINITFSKTGGQCEGPLVLFGFREPSNNAICGGMTFPTTMYAGETAAVSLTMGNSGDFPWIQADNYRLGSDDPAGNLVWGLNRIDLNPGEVIDLWQTKTFNFNITAPEIAPTTDQSCRWRMLQEGVQWFGESCGTDITVLPGCPSNFNLTCTNPFTIQASWISGPEQVLNYNLRANHDQPNNAECMNGPNPVGWFCGAEGDQFLTVPDAIPNSGTDYNVQTIAVTPGVEYGLSVQSLDSRGAAAPGCRLPGPDSATSITCPTPTAAISGNIYEDDAAAMVGGACDAVCSGDTSSGISLTDASVRATRPGGENSSGIINGNGYIIITEETSDDYTVILQLPTPAADSSNVWSCACCSATGDPFTCEYLDMDSPQTDVDFFLINNDLSYEGWWQVAGASVYSVNNMRSDVAWSDTGGACNDDPLCFAGMIAGKPLDTSTVKDTTGFPFVGPGVAINTHQDEGAGDEPGYVHVPDSREGDNADNAYAIGLYLDPQDYQDYAYFNNRFGNSADVITSEMSTGNPSKPSTSGIHKVTGDVTIDETDNWSVGSGESFVVLIDGNLTIEDTTGGNQQIITVAEGGYVAFIVNGNITIADSVGYDSSHANFQSSDPDDAVVQGVFVTSRTGDLIIDTDGDDNTQDLKFMGAGTFVGWGGVSLSRTYFDSALGSMLNRTNPTEIFIFRPDFVENTPAVMQASEKTQRQVAPHLD